MSERMLIASSPLFCLAIALCSDAEPCWCNFCQCCAFSASLLGVQVGKLQLNTQSRIIRLPFYVSVSCGTQVAVKEAEMS